MNKRISMKQMQDFDAHSANKRKKREKERENTHFTAF